MPRANHQTRTLWLCGILHAFTHLYQVALLPLYFLIQKDLRLPGVEGLTLLVTIMMAAYYLPSYYMGKMADHWDKKKLLTGGLALNALGYLALSQSPNYPLAVLSTIIAGIGGSAYHPAATALIAHLFPQSRGKAIGLLSIGASLGFFIGPYYAAHRAATAGWRAPIFELGLFGIAGAIAFFYLAADDPQPHPHAEPPREKMFHTPRLWLTFAAAAFAFSFRDFTGNSMSSLASLFLQQAHHFTIQKTGIALATIFLASTISNPLFGKLSDRGRLRWALGLLLIAAALVIAFPLVPPAAAIPTLIIYGFFFMASYPIVEVAVMESVHETVRGRAFGFFITIGGVVGNLAHWIMGLWVEKLGPTSAHVPSYYPIYATLAAFILISLLGLPILGHLKKEENAHAQLAS